MCFYMQEENGQCQGDQMIPVRIFQVIGLQNFVYSCARVFYFEKCSPHVGGCMKMNRGTMMDRFGYEPGLQPTSSGYNDMLLCWNLKVINIPTTFKRKSRKEKKHSGPLNQMSSMETHRYRCNNPILLGFE